MSKRQKLNKLVGYVIGVSFGIWAIYSAISSSTAYSDPYAQAGANFASVIWGILGGVAILLCCVSFYRSFVKPRTGGIK